MELRFLNGKLQYCRSLIDNKWVDVPNFGEKEKSLREDLIDAFEEEFKTPKPPIVKSYRQVATELTDIAIKVIKEHKDA